MANKPIFDTILFIFKIHITNLACLKNGSSCFTKFLDCNTKESNKIKKLNKTTAISNNNNKHLLDLSNLKIKQVKKRKKKPNNAN